MSQLLNLVVNDARRTFRAFARMIRLMNSKEKLADSIPASISLLSTPSFKCIKGIDSNYTLVLASPSGVPRLFRLIIDIYKKVPDPGTDGHVAYALRDILIGEVPVNILFRYNWDNNAKFVVDGVEAEPDTFWRGVPASDGVYHFRALLRTLDDQTIESLQLSQHLTADSTAA